MINCAAGKNIHFVPLLFFEDVNCVHGKLLPRDAGAKRFICAPLFLLLRHAIINSAAELAF
jgi:hypothetical protein